MKIEPIPAPPLTRASSSRRARGVHLKSVVDALWRTLHGEKEREFTEADLRRMEVGFIWEELLSMAFGKRLGYRPKDLYLDGIYANPDAVKLPEGYFREFKCTWKSSTRRPDEDWRWMAQVKGYAYMLQMPVCEMHILHVNGDYRERVPHYKVWRLEFTEQELRENWEMIVNFAKQMKEDKS